MNFLRRLERALGWITIGHLPVYIVTAQAIVYFWMMVNPGSGGLLVFDPVRIVYANEYWRAVTFLFVPPRMHPIFLFFFLYFLYLCGRSLEEEWGSFRLTLFYLVGALLSIGAGFLSGGLLNTAFYLNETIFLAFAALYPNFTVHLFLVLPVKVKWLAWFVWAHIAFSLFASPWPLKIAILLSITNFFLFFGGHYASEVKAWIRRKNFERSQR